LIFRKATCKGGFLFVTLESPTSGGRNFQQTMERCGIGKRQRDNISEHGQRESPGRVPRVNVEPVGRD
jgi:hypothetical protein